MAPLDGDGQAPDRDILASIVDSSQDAIWTKRLDGTVTSWNKAAEAMLGYTAEEMIGRPVHLVFPPERLAEETEIMTRVSRGERVAPFETVRLRKDGSRIDVSVALSPLRDATGLIVGASQVARDITERKALEVAEKAAATTELTRLKEMNEFRVRFLNVAAHELKTPLTPIGLQLHLLRLLLKDNGDPKVQGSVGILLRAVERLKQLVGDVLDAARIEANQLRLKTQAIDLAGLVREALDTYGEVARGVNIHLTIELASPVWVKADPVRLLQVVNNLLSNAIKFTPPGGSIHVRLELDGGQAVLRVRDTGRGLTSEQAQRLFQPFVQVHPNLEATTQGTGLGLYIVKAIVEQHGGTITIESPGADQGATVTVRLPVGSPGAAAGPKRTPGVEPNQRLRELM